MKTSIRITMFITVFLILLMDMFLHFVTAFAWGDSTYLEGAKEGEFRTLYKLDDINNGKLGSTITFDSITDAEIGDERDFVSVQEAAPDGYAIDPHGTWNGGSIAAEDGQEYIVRLYVHNNSPKGTAGVSTGTKVAISGVNEHGTWQSKTNKDGKQEVELNGFITSDNATPHEYWDYVRFNSSTSFHLDYVYGSAMIYNRGATGTTDKPISAADMMTATDEQLKAQTITGRPLSDDIVLKTRADGELDGQLIGFDALDGNVPGCDEYSNFVTIRVKVVYDNNFAVKATVRHAGEKEWRECIDAKVGDKVEIQIKYANTSNEQQDDVAIRNILPANLHYIAGSTKIKNARYRNGNSIDEDFLTTDGIIIGNYGPGANAYLMFTAEVVDDDLAEGLNTIENVALGGPGSTTIEDSIKITVQNNKSYNIIITVHVVLIVIFLTCIAILICRIAKRNKIQKS